MCTISSSIWSVITLLYMIVFIMCIYTHDCIEDNVMTLWYTLGNWGENVLLWTILAVVLYHREKHDTVKVPP